MLEKITVFKTAYAMARHAGARQAVLAENIANADTPGYRAKDLAPFSTGVSSKDAATTMIATRATHLGGSNTAAPLAIAEVRNRATDPNKNSISLQEEMLNAVEAKRQHDRALAIYKSGMRILRSSLGGR